MVDRASRWQMQDWRRCENASREEVCLNVIAGLRLQKLVENPNHVEEMELSSPTYAKLQAEIVVH
jgi:hypothetical protein